MAGQSIWTRHANRNLFFAGNIDSSYLKKAEKYNRKFRKHFGN